MTLDVFLTSFRGGEEVAVDGDALETALAANGISRERATVRTTDGGDAEVLVDTDGASFLIDRLSPELSRLLFDIARDAELVVLPADGTPNVYLVDRHLAGDLPDDLEARVVTRSGLLYEALSESQRARGARTP